VQSKVLETVDDSELAVYAVWEPILRTDDERAARKATILLPDPRVVHYWVDSQEVGKTFQEPIELTTEPAWDVYLVYPREVKWGDSAPEPNYFMHQLGGRLPASSRLNAERLAQLIVDTLAEPQGN
jgi:hypothetical protein